MAKKQDDFEYASLNMRIFGFFIDTIIISIVTSPIIAMLMPWINPFAKHEDKIRELSTRLELGAINKDEAMNYLSEPEVVKFFIFTTAASMLCFLLCILLMFWFMNGASIGTKLIGCKVVDYDTGNLPTKKQILLRFYGCIINCLTLGIDTFFINSRECKQALHDKIAKTVVIRKTFNKSPEQLLNSMFGFFVPKKK